MIYNKISYCFKTAFYNLRKHLLLSAVTATTIAITFIIFIFFLVVVINLSSFKNNWVDRLQVILYLENGADAAAIDETRTFITGLPEVDSVRFVSRDDALIMLKKSLEGQDGILQGLEENPLPASLEIKLKKEYLTPERVEIFVEKIKTIRPVEDIEYGQKWLERFTTIFTLLKIMGITFGGLLFLFAFFIISNTIRLLVYSRRDEIEIMKLVGATNRFIKLPFCIEAGIQGLVGSSCALLFVTFVVRVLMSEFIVPFQFYVGQSSFVFLTTTQSVFIIVLGLVLGLCGSLFSLNNLKELKN